MSHRSVGGALRRLERLVHCRAGQRGSQRLSHLRADARIEGIVAFDARRQQWPVERPGRFFVGGEQAPDLGDVFRTGARPAVVDLLTTPTG